MKDKEVCFDQPASQSTRRAAIDRSSQSHVEEWSTPLELIEKPVRNSMRLRLMSGQSEIAVLDVASEDALVQQLTGLAKTIQDVAGKSLQIHLWHQGSWWNLSDDMGHFVQRSIQDGHVSEEDLRRFAHAPLSRPDWLYEAALQMLRVLKVYDVLDHKDDELSPGD